MRPLQRRKALILSVVVASVLVALVYNYTARPVFRAEALLRIVPESSAPASGAAEARGGPRRSGPATGEHVQILKSRALVGRVVESLAPEAAADLRSGNVMSPWERLRRRLRPEAEPEFDDDGLPVVSGAGAGTAESRPPLSPPATDAGSIPAAGPLVQAYRSRLTVQAQGQTGLIRLSFLAYDGRVAADALALLIRAHREAITELGPLSGSLASPWLGERVEEQRRRIEQAKAALQVHAEAADLAAIQARILELEARVGEASRALIEAQAARAAREAELERSRASADGGVPETVQRLREQVAELESQRARLDQTLGERHPEMIRVVAALKEAQAALAAEVLRASQALEGAFQEALRQEQGLEQTIAQLQQELTDLRLRGTEQGLLHNEVEANEEALARLTGQAEGAQAVAPLSSGSIEVVEPPVRPTRPEWPRRLQNLQTALLGGLLGGVLLALVVEGLDRTIRRPEDLVAGLGSTFLGGVPEVSVPRGAARILLVTRSPRAALTEAFGAIRAGLMASAPERGATVLVCSVHSGEGASTVAAHLAASLALDGRRVVLVDTSGRRPMAHALLGMPLSPGLGEFDLGSVTAETVARPSGVARLDLVSAGAATARVSPSRTIEIVASLRARYDWVILDVSSPREATGAALAPLVDGVILVVATGRTTLSELARAADQFAALGGRVLGTVLNREATRSGRSG